MRKPVDGVSNLYSLWLAIDSVVIRLEQIRQEFHNSEVVNFWQEISFLGQCKKLTMCGYSNTDARQNMLPAASFVGQVLRIQNQNVRLCALISLSTTITLLNTMAVLESCPKHNMVAYLEKTDGNAEFHDIIDFLTCSSIHHALTIRSFPRPSTSTTIPYSIPESSGGNLGGFRIKPRKFENLKAQIQEAQEASQTCQFTHHKAWIEENVILKAKIEGKRSLKEKLDAKGVICIQIGGWKYAIAKKKFKQLASDEEMARKVQEEWEREEERKRLAEEEATNDALIRNYDDIKARIEADRLLAEKLQEEEREQFTIEERAKFLHDIIAAQKKFLAQQRSEAIKNRPPTKNQLRNQMMTYLKHVGNFKHSDLKTKKFDALYEKIKRSDEDFISIGSAEDERLIKKMNEKGIDSSKNEMVKEEDKEEEGTKKRKGGHIKMIARKKARKQSDVDSDDEHKKCLKIVTFESILDSEIMEKKSVIARLSKVSSPDGDYLVIYRANGNFRAFNYLMEVLHIFDRQDLFHLYDLMREQFSEVTLDGFVLILWGDLKIMMESSTEGNELSDFWSGQQDWKIVTWRLYESCGVCILEFEDGIVIHMLVERRYPLS
ncbi:hypothetical protein Tco_0713659, partial [Tanacetum coccineum]